MKVFLTILVLISLSGCATIEQDSERGIPPLLFHANSQTNTLIIMGVESNAKWDDIRITTANSLVPCEVKHPTSGPMIAGDTIHVLTEGSITDCKIEIKYNSHDVGQFLFKPERETEYVRSTITQTVTQTQTHAPSENKTEDK
jgi:hypothetical protein